MGTSSSRTTLACNNCKCTWSTQIQHKSNMITTQNHPTLGALSTPANHQCLNVQHSVTIFQIPKRLKEGVQCQVCWVQYHLFFFLFKPFLRFPKSLFGAADLFSCFAQPQYIALHTYWSHVRHFIPVSRCYNGQVPELWLWSFPQHFFESCSVGQKLKQTLCLWLVLSGARGWCRDIQLGCCKFWCKGGDGHCPSVAHTERRCLPGQFCCHICTVLELCKTDVIQFRQHTTLPELVSSY